MPFNIDTSTVNSTSYVALVSGSGYNPGDTLVSTTRIEAGAIQVQTWYNENQRSVIALPGVNDLIALDLARSGQNVTRLINSTASVLQIKTTNTLIQSIYVDNLGALSYLGIHQGLSSAPVTGSAPLESYRIPANGSISLTLERVYIGQTWLSFSSTPGNITLASVAKNLIVRFN